MAVIGVDCAGKVDSLPMYMVAARGDDSRVIYVKRVPLWVKRGHREWKRIAYACYAFKAIKPLFRKKPVIDTVLMDRDFDVEGLQRARRYMEYLLQNYFVLPGCNIVEVGDDSDTPVKTADIISKLAYKRKTKFSVRDPNISREFKYILEKL